MEKDEMARMTMEAPILGTQYIEVNGVSYGKVFIGEEPDGKSEHIASVQQMNIKSEVAREVFESGQQFKLGQVVRFTIETDRGGKQSVKNEVVHIAALEQPQRQASSAPQQKPAEPAKG
ncbi:hypothetical protein DK254_13210 [Pseudomonas sp. RW407]|uniref:hypothetical protein n=1 Tax=Pseudomonas sp. RW407 TaxID=2202894 RepID=UPI000D6F3B31|nr:hypothetical protein [Pseudomonas sp. RW407]PWU29118.1 hypothetical protein DK254_13210 [Pseudomonas sp. RW407]